MTLPEVPARFRWIRFILLEREGRGLVVGVPLDHTYNRWPIGHVYYAGPMDDAKKRYALYAMYNTITGKALFLN